MPPKFDFSKAKRQSPKSTVRSRGVTAEDVQASRRSLEGVHHVKAISPGRVKEHQRMLKRWRLYVEDLVDPAIPVEPKFGVEFPDEAVIKNFILWLGHSTNGAFGEFASVKTIKSYFWTWFAAWKRYSSCLLDRSVRDNCSAYLESIEFREQCRLTTRAREKPVASIVDAQCLIDECWMSDHIFGSNRFRLSMAYAINLEAITSARPGEVVESSSHARSNEALEWRDHEFYMVPNEDDPLRPGFFLFVTFRLLKKHRDDESINKTVVFYYDPDEKMGHSLILQAFMLALSDGVFLEIDQPSDIFEPKSPLKKVTKLEMREEWKRRPVIRARQRGEMDF